MTTEIPGPTSDASGTFEVTNVVRLPADERKGVTVAQVADLQPEQAPAVQIQGCPPPPERLGIPRNEDGTYQDAERELFIDTATKPESVERIAMTLGVDPGATQLGAVAAVLKDGTPVFIKDYGKVLSDADDAYEKARDKVLQKPMPGFRDVLPENSLDQTVRNPAWLAENREKLRELFPETFTHPANINFLQIRFRLKLYGVDYRSEREFLECMVELDKAGIVQTQGEYLLRRGPK